MKGSGAETNRGHEMDSRVDENCISAGKQLSEPKEWIITVSNKWDFLHS